MRLRFGPFVLDPQRATLTREGEPVELQPKAFDLIALLCAHPDRIFSRQELLDTLWPGTHVTEASLHQSFRKARKALGDDPDQPRFIEVVSRRGWRWVAPVEPLPDASPGDLVGRQALLAELAARLQPGAAVVLHGPGGVGKTRLAREAVALATERWRGATVSVSLARCACRAEVARALGRALEVPLEAPLSAEVVVGRALAGRALLVLLDEAEASAAELAALLEGWRAEHPRVCWLITSRVALAGLPLLEVPPLQPPDAAALLRARAASEGATLTDGEVSALLAQLDGLPLAIELAAGRLRLMSAERLVERLARGSAVLSSVSGRSVQAALTASWELLEEQDRHLLCGCAIFEGSFSVDEVEAAAGADVLDGLDRLLGASLLARTSEGLSLMGFVRTFAAERASAGYGAAFVEGFVRSMVRAAQALLPLALRFDTDALLALRERRSRWSAAHALASAPEDRETLAVALAFACRYGGPWDLADEALCALQRPGLAGRLLRGEYAARLGRTGEAEAWLSGVDPALPESAYARFLLARLYAATGRLQAALEQAELALQRAEQDGNDAVAGLALDAMGTVWRLRADPEAVRRCYGAASARLQRRSCRIVRGVVAQNQAANLSTLGLYDEGIVGLAAALDALQDLPVPHLVAIVRGNLAQALLTAGRASEARPLLEMAMAAAERTGDRRGAGKHALDLALALILLGDGQRSEALVEALLEEARAAPAPLARILACWAWAALCRGAAALAVARASAALDACGPDEVASGWATELWALSLALARQIGDEAFEARLRASPPAQPPGAELWAWAQDPARPDPAQVASGQLPVDTWALWAARHRS